ncbi:hypothetical protein K490DRAFT_54508 [Saccharata proteae CBS 121410]|uniref:Uncharacterized protein n=1 Tax=Saccharata proteae CBS 121410 TaxID=1314787 RepID=A0A9P4HVV1_9PEZI|nr:hypothetical protein K490DRAFT_54508 [Saccharata proteae CBS 121410]
MPLENPATSLTWTLRLKHHRTTILIHADPLTTLSALRNELLHALRETERTGTLNGRALPADASAFELARPVDPADLDKGWIGLGTAGATGGKKREREDENVKNADVRDGGVIAFRWRVEGEQGTVDEYDVDGEGNVVERDWDVVVPKLEDYDEMEDEGVDA